MSASETWHGIVKEAIAEEMRKPNVPEICKVDKAAIRAALRQSRKGHTVRVKSKLP